MAGNKCTYEYQKAGKRSPIIKNQMMERNSNVNTVVLTQERKAILHSMSYLTVINKKLPGRKVTRESQFTREQNMIVADVITKHLTKVIFPSISKWYMKEKIFYSVAVIPKSLSCPSEQNGEGQHIIGSISALNVI
eukprot:TRINITY_DN9021_c0_g1_i1.p1 TRINITY_DN9021_c0_g1~~TRINITY_DN9021_c0_g1_i1.p1  ORF type:complete len:136 (+),score=21.41 TRINITY_DN9021_c0_g1_i1:85-492(+)